MGLIGAESDTTDRRLLTTAQVAALLQVSPKTVGRLARAGRLERIQLGYRQARYSPRSVDALIDQNFTAESPSPSGREVTKARAG